MKQYLQRSEALNARAVTGECASCVNCTRLACMFFCFFRSVFVAVAFDADSVVFLGPS